MITIVNKNKILQIFFEQPEKKFHLRELSRLTGLSIAGVIKIVKKLKADNLLISKKERAVEIVEADLEGKFTYYKRADNLISLYDSGLVKKLEGFYEQPKSIVLFGSYAEGTDTSRSDIDIAVITKIDKLPDINKFERKLKRKINILTVNLDKAKASFKNSLTNGIVLSGFLEVINDNQGI